MGKIAIPYVRMSTAEQLKGSSMQRQSSLIREYADKNDLELDLETDYTDIGKSAYKSRHLKKEAGLARFLEAVQVGKIKPGTILIIESLDRLSRQEIKQALSMFLRILEAGIEIHTISSTEANKYTKDSDERDIIFSLFLFSRANEESRLKSRRLKESWKIKRERAASKKEPISARLPAWLILKDSKIEVVTDRAAIVKKIFEMSASGVGRQKIAKLLNEREVPVFGRGKFWHKSTVDKILKNRAVFGVYEPTVELDGKRVIERTIEGYFPVVVSEQLFNKVNYLNNNTPGRRSYFSNIFTGLVHCAICNSNMIMINKGQGSKGGKYLVCESARNGLGCKYHSVRYDWLETNIIPFMSGLRLDLIESQQQESIILSELESLTIEVNQLQEKINALEKQMNSLIDEGEQIPKFLTRKLYELEEIHEQKSVERQSKKAKSSVEEISLSDARAALEKIDPFDFESRARINSSLKRLVDDIVVEIFKSGRKTVASVSVHMKSDVTIEFILNKNFEDNDIIYIGSMFKVFKLRLSDILTSFKEKGKIYHDYRDNMIYKLLYNNLRS